MPTEGAISHTPIEHEEFILVSGSQPGSAPASQKVQISRSKPVSSVRGEEKKLSWVTGKVVAGTDHGIATAIARRTAGNNGVSRKTRTLVEDEEIPALQVCATRQK